MQQVLDRFIVLEGLDGAGTTTQMKAVAEAFDRAQVPCHATFEPTLSAIGGLLRRILHKEVVTTSYAIALLFAADREDHLYNPVSGLVKMMEEGTPVICDRYLFSSLAYQGIECGLERIRALNDFPLPRFLFYLDTPIADCIRRIQLRDGGTDLFDRQDFLVEVQKNYEHIFSDLPEEVHFVRVDGTASKQEVTDQIISVLREAELL